MTWVPYLPENAPFTNEQRAYLNGFLAGLFARTPVDAGAGQSKSNPAATPAVALQPLTILFGSQTGNAENLAKRAARDAGKRGFAATIQELGRFPTTQLPQAGAVLILTSTYGDGEPPDNAKSFWDFVSASAAPELTGLRYSVCALGDSNYPKFCAFGKALDERLTALGAQAVQPRVDCDVDFEVPFATWLSAALSQLGGASSATVVALQESSAPPRTSQTTNSAHSKENPFPASLRQNVRLNGDGSAKDVRHLAFDLTGSNLSYEPGDALGVVPANDPTLVAELLTALGLDGDAPVARVSGAPGTLREALTLDYEITRIPKSLLATFAERTQDTQLLQLAAPDANGSLTQFLRGREIIDLCLAYPAVRFEPAEFVGRLRRLQPRLYSIASSPRQHPGEVHLTVGTVRYESLGRRRQGVCSTFLADRVGPETRVPVFVHANPGFRPPSNSTPLIMVGPGTGIAPFRAFLEDRLAAGAAGKNWLFFGDQHAATDFLYREEVEQFQRRGLLHRLDLAWSRDQGEKVYVQDRMQAQSAELWRWLEDGAAFYVCGDAARMAKDVDAALHAVIRTAGQRSPEAAADYVRQLQSAGRYRRDVY